MPQSQGNYYYPPPEYSGYQQPQQSVIQGPYVTYQQPPQGAFEIPPSSTSELYSSTYAMLSNDGISTHSEWLVNGRKSLARRDASIRFGFRDI